MGKAKYTQWDLEDSLTRAETATILRERISKLLKRKLITPATVARMLKNLEEKRERGLIS